MTVRLIVRRVKRTICLLSTILAFTILTNAYSTEYPSDHLNLNILPPIKIWHGSSESLIQSHNNPWQTNQGSPDKMDFQGIDFRQLKDPLTGLDYVQWPGKPRLYKDLPIYRMNKPKQSVNVPKYYWIPPQYHQVIEKLRLHGIKMMRINQPKTVEVTEMEAFDYKFDPQPFEGRQMVTSQFTTHKKKVKLPRNTVQVSTDQDLGRLAVVLLDPRAPDSLFTWGYFNSMLQRTEDIESYALIPLVKQLVSTNKNLQIEFENKKKNEPNFAKNQKSQMQWSYKHSAYYDNHFLQYPVLISQWY